ncbi:hypothetical protein SAMD00079811_46440 [Scytonema sp. HK-05]|uniref:DUF937 domain-containing protein n=1 Tax=Scytonema sp. HK-05 TaxID=1137095 RepID=UPI000937802B|nr:DUF937 domain-containing protein [Scytonema sp. HK-05]OKH58501.1 hypothetical protein NIES2130_13525 [Scytonema sp. HK-05]BAY47028.1 hypothetical protein SAMD00079811_46440 [Scytonema sp. HK-05]
MGLFDQIINAIDNSNQQGNAGQLGNILNTVQQVSNSTGTDPSTIQSALGIVGNYVRSALQEKQATEGNEAAQSVVNQFGGTSPNPQAVNSLFAPFLQQQLAQTVAQRTGLNAGIVQQLLPILVPVVLNLLKSGAHSQNPQAGGNPVLNSFLDSDRDGDVDIMDAIQLASRYLGR